MDGSMPPLAAGDAGVATALLLLLLAGLGLGLTGWRLHNAATAAAAAAAAAADSALATLQFAKGRWTPAGWELGTRARPRTRASRSQRLARLHKAWERGSSRLHKIHTTHNSSMGELPWELCTRELQWLVDSSRTLTTLRQLEIQLNLGTRICISK